MNEEIIRRLMNKGILTLDEVKSILDYIANDIRSTMDVNDPYTRLCKESSMAIWNICDKFNIPYIPFSMSDIGMGDLEHHFGITGFQTEYGQLCFLLDLTYIQFTSKTYSINVKNEKSTKLVTSPGMFVSEENKGQLVESGYLILTEENFDDYISGFIESYRLANPIDERVVYDSAYDLLLKYNINLVNKNYSNNQGITY